MGERSRIFLARALLQRPDVVVLEECLEGLDPVTLAGVVRFVGERAAAVIAVAHR